MLRPDNSLPEVYLHRDIVDFLKGINGLSIRVEQVLLRNPFSEQLFVFCNRSRTAIKRLYFEGSGFVLWHKKLEKATFYWPKSSSDKVITLTGQELNWLLDGYDLAQSNPINIKNRVVNPYPNHFPEWMLSMILRTQTKSALMMASHSNTLAMKSANSWKSFPPNCRLFGTSDPSTPVPVVIRD